MMLFVPRGAELVGQPQGANVQCTVLSAEWDAAVVCRAGTIPVNWQHYILLKYRVRVRLPTVLLVQGYILSPFDERDYGNNLLNYAIPVTETTAGNSDEAQASEETARARAEWAAEMDGGRRTADGGPGTEGRLIPGKGR